MCRWSVSRRRDTGTSETKTYLNLKRHVYRFINIIIYTDPLGGTAAIQEENVCIWGGQFWRLVYEAKDFSRDINQILKGKTRGP